MAAERKGAQKSLTELEGRAITLRRDWNSARDRLRRIEDDTLATDIESSDLLASLRAKELLLRALPVLPEGDDERANPVAKEPS